MENKEVKNIIINALEEHGREKIEQGLRMAINSNDDVYLVVKENGTLELFSEEQMKNNVCIFLLNLGNHEGEWEYKEIHFDHLEMGLTKTEDFDEWFDNECCLDSEVDTYYEIVEDKINTELLSFNICYDYD